MQQKSARFLRKRLRLRHSSKNIKKGEIRNEEN